jgi:hypothetical protein
MSARTDGLSTDFGYDWCTDGSGARMAQTHAHAHEIELLEAQTDASRQSRRMYA